MNWILKKYTPLILALVVGPLFAILFSSGAALKSPINFLIASGWSISIWLTQWYGNEFVYKTVEHKISWLKQPIKKIVVLFFSVALYSSFAIIVVNLTLNYIVFGGVPENFSAWAIYNGRIAIVIALSISTVITAMLFFRSWKQAAVNEEKLKNELLEYKYKSLVNQVNPHFLFNSLNVLTALVHEDPNLADQFIRQLSKIYRYTLENRERDLVTIDQEKDFIESYLFLLKIRFENSLDYDLNLEPSSDGYLIPMALQILVENAIKHNRVSKEHPLKIKIQQCEDSICVSNNLQITKKFESTGMGLENIRKRLNFLTDRTLEIEKSNDFFSVKLPVLKVIK